MKKGPKTTPMTGRLLSQVRLGHSLQRSPERYEQEFQHQGDHTALPVFMTCRRCFGLSSNFSRISLGITI
jgi:hypothetical protein